MGTKNIRRFTPPHFFHEVCGFAVQEVMSVGIGELGEHDYTVSDCLTVAMLYGRNSLDFRLPNNSALALLYNSFADYKRAISRRSIDV